MSAGWISLHRKIQSNPYWLSEPFTRGQAWVDLLLLANHKDNFIRVRGMKINVKRGQVGMSQVKLSERWKWSKGKLVRFLNELESEQQIEQQKNNVSSLISISNYDEYQQVGQQIEQQTGQQTDSRQDTNNNDNNINNTSIWLEKAKPEYLDFCKAYFEMLLNNEKIKANANWKTKAWYDSARLMVEADKIPLDHMYRGIKFLDKHIQDQYCPQTYSMASFREKWMQLRSYKDRLTPTNSNVRQGGRV